MQDMILSQNKGNDDWGIKGYSFRKFNPFMDKPPNFKIIKSKTRDLMADLIKHKKDFPGPKYETAGNMLMKQKISIYKLPRITALAEEQKRHEKDPAPGQYH